MTAGGVRRARKDEQEVGEPVQVDERQRADRMSAGCGQGFALRATADRARNVKPRGALAPTGEDEALELGQLGVEVVAVALESVDLLLRDAQAALALHRNREIGPEIEELVLDTGEHLADRLWAVSGLDDSHRRVQLVDGPERGDPRVELRYPGAVAERRLPLIAAARVDLRQPDRFVAFTGHARRLGGMLVRPARTGEADTIADVFVPSFRGLTFLPTIHTDDEIRTWIRNEMFPRHEVWVAEIAGEIVGFAALSGELLGHLYVHPDEQCRGVGTALLDIAKRQRPNGFRFWVFQRNEGARRFYERHGCRLVELTDGSGNEEREPDALYEWAP